jgi:hypothetical protein
MGATTCTPPHVRVCLTPMLDSLQLTQCMEQGGVGCHKDTNCAAAPMRCCAHVRVQAL